MNPLTAIQKITEAQSNLKKPLAIIVAGHNGSGKSTFWHRTLANELQLPLVNADRMMLSILPEPTSDGSLVPWARTLRDEHQGWMQVAQRGVHAFVGHALAAKVPFALETVFSDWRPQPDGTFASKIDQIKQLQAAGYYVLLIFVGLATVEISMARVATRVSEHGHDVPPDKLRDRFPRTQTAISHALSVADASLLADNSRTRAEAFTICRVQTGSTEQYDVRAQPGPVPPVFSAWLDVVSPRP